MPGRATRTHRSAIQLGQRGLYGPAPSLHRLRRRLNYRQDGVRCPAAPPAQSGQAHGIRDLLPVHQAATPAPGRDAFR